MTLRRNKVLVGLLAFGLPLFAGTSPASAGTGVENVAEIGSCGDRTADGTVVVPPDANGDGLPDFPDTDGDGVPDIPVGNPGDFDILCTDANLQQFLADFDIGEGGTLDGPCFGVVWSYDEDGNVIDGAADFSEVPGDGPVDIFGGGEFSAAFTSGNPFKVDPNGDVAYAGNAIDVDDLTPPASGDGQGPRNHEWQIEMAIDFGLTQVDIAVDSGGDDNPDREDNNAGLANLDALPAIPAVVKAQGSISNVSNGGTFACDGAGYFELVNVSAVANPLTVLSTFLAGGALVGAFFNARPAITWFD